MKKLAFLAVAAFLFSGCVKNNPDPAWLEVSEWTLENNSSISDSQEGELVHNFTDAWVYIDGELIGVFEVPFKVPVLVSGEHQIKLYPTVRNNGIASTKKIYPFVEPYIITANLVQNQTLSIDPTTMYKDNVSITLWDFEDGTNVGFDSTPESTTAIAISSDPSIIQATNGGGFGRVNMDSNNDFWQATSSQDFTDLPQSGAEVYLELDYHNTVAVVTGVLALEPSNVVSNPNVQLNSQDPSEVKWKRIYIDLKTIISGSIDANAFRMSYEAYLPDSLTTGQINLDNIKLVHF